jgi:hypothetical protein
VKLSDDVIEEAFTLSATVVQRYFTRSAVLWAFCRPNRRFEFDKRGQQFIRVHNETLPVVAMSVCNPELFAPQNPGLMRSPKSNRLC